jgi:hypothetical protein
MLSTAPFHCAHHRRSTGRQHESGRSLDWASPTGLTDAVNAIRDRKQLSVHSGQAVYHSLQLTRNLAMLR